MKLLKIGGACAGIAAAIYILGKKSAEIRGLEAKVYYYDQKLEQLIEMSDQETVHRFREELDKDQEFFVMMQEKMSA